MKQSVSMRLKENRVTFRVARELEEEKTDQFYKMRASAIGLKTAHCDALANYHLG